MLGSDYLSTLRLQYCLPLSINVIKYFLMHFVKVHLVLDCPQAEVKTISQALSKHISVLIFTLGEITNILIH